MRLGLVIPFLVMAFIFPIFIANEAHAANFGIQISNTCLTFVKNNFSHPCPSYEQILAVFPDHSNKKISGDFVYKDGYLHRENTKYKNQYLYYQYVKDPVVFIDPPADTINKIKLIKIVPRLDEYKVEHIGINKTEIPIGYNRYVNENCSIATITAQDWLFLTGDTLRYMKHDCDPKFTNFDEIKIKSWERTIHDITTSYKWQLDQWIKESLQKCKTWRCK